MDGLIHISQLVLGRRVEVVEDVVLPGDRVFVKVLRVEDGGRRISLSMSAVDQETGSEQEDWREPKPRGRGRAESGDATEQRFRRESGPLGPPPKVHSIHRAVVGTIKDFGVFATLESNGWEGLIHISQLCDRHVDSPDEVVSRGMRVWVKISEVADDETKKDKFRISMTMKYVDQSNGKDLDPTNEDLIEDLQGNRPTGAQRRLHVNVAMKISEHGGSANQQYGSDNKKYEMIPSDDDEGEDHIGGRGVNGSATMSAISVPSVGRGRASTMPAWMTKDPSDMKDDEKRSSSSKKKKKKEEKEKEEEKEEEEEEKEEKRRE